MPDSPDILVTMSCGTRIPGRLLNVSASGLVAAAAFLADGISGNPSPCRRCTRPPSWSAAISIGSLDKLPGIVDALIAAAKKHKADIIVMASHGRKGVKRLLLRYAPLEKL